jgi:hypothetical protein
MRLWPYRKASSTVGSAMIAITPITIAAVGWPSWRMISASGSALWPNTA